MKFLSPITTTTTITNTTTTFKFTFTSTTTTNNGVRRQFKLKIPFQLNILDLWKEGFAIRKNGKIRTRMSTNPLKHHPFKLTFTTTTPFNL